MHNAIARTLSIVRQNVVPREPSPTPASPVPADKKPPTDEVKPDSTTHAHEVWLHARPLDHLAVWAYFALAIIVAITCLVLCYLIYTCCQKAVIVQKEDDKWTEVKEGEVVVELTELKGKRLKRPVRGRGRAVMDRSEIESGASLTPSVLMHGWKGLTRSRQGDSMNDTDPVSIFSSFLCSSELSLSSGRRTSCQRTFFRQLMRSRIRPGTGEVI